jgi:ectoine hydroxylase-related dioxygenase (phytanoyl-CoA dioxygenase family)
MTRSLTRSVAHWSDRLLRDGYCIIPDAVPADAVAALRADLAPVFDETPFCQGGFYGERTKRFGRLLARSGLTAAFVQHPVVLGVTERVLRPWCDTIQLNVAQAIAVYPRSPQQLPHRDQDMWRLPVSEAEHLVNVIWPFTDFHAENGATLVWPHSHGANALRPEPDAAPIVAAMRPGSALLFLGSTLHGAGPNVDGGVRDSMVIGYAAGWLKPYENQWLAYPPEVARRFPPELAALVGYRQHRPNLGNYEGQCPSVLLRPDGPGPLAATDALRPEQKAAVDDFVAAQGFGG